MNRFQALACIVAVCVLHSTSSAQPLQQRIKQAVARADASIAKVVATPGRARTFANTFGALDKMNSQLDRDTSLPIFMQYVSTDSTVREDARAAQQILDDWLIELSKREDLYKAIKSYADTKP